MGFHFDAAVRVDADASKPAVGGLPAESSHLALEATLADEAVNGSRAAVAEDVPILLEAAAGHLAQLAGDRAAAVHGASLVVDDVVGAIRVKRARDRLAQVAPMLTLLVAPHGSGVDDGLDAVIVEQRPVDLGAAQAAAGGKDLGSFSDRGVELAHRADQHWQALRLGGVGRHDLPGERELVHSIDDEVQLVAEPAHLLRPLGTVCLLFPRGLDGPRQRPGRLSCLRSCASSRCHGSGSPCHRRRASSRDQGFDCSTLPADRDACYCTLLPGA